VEQLKLAIIKEWRNLSQHFIDRSTGEWHQRLEKVVEKQGDTLNMFYDYRNTWQTAVYDKSNYINFILLNNYDAMSGSHFL